MEAYMEVESHDIRGVLGEKLGEVEGFSSCWKGQFEAESREDAMFLALRQAYAEVAEARPLAQAFKIEVAPHHGMLPRFVFKYDRSE